MPELSRFFGIIIRMYSEPGSAHNEPHFHAYYQGDPAVFTISPVGMFAGYIPRKQQRFVEAWAELHQEELLAAWDFLLHGRRVNPIKPLE
jgi:hypothetical protein